MRPDQWLKQPGTAAGYLSCALVAAGRSATREAVPRGDSRHGGVDF